MSVDGYREKWASNKLWQATPKSAARFRVPLLALCAAEQQR
jgi:hypothetical protein